MRVHLSLDVVFEQTTDTCVVATASADSSANIYNINTGMTLQKLRGHHKSVNKVA
jgi:WD40 repeat protein